MRKTVSIFATLAIALSLTSCGWDVKDPESEDVPQVVPGNDFPEISGTEISVDITSPDMPESLNDVHPADEQIHVTGYGCEGNMYFKWKKGDVLYAVNQRTGEISEIVTQQDDVITAHFTGYSHKGIQKEDTYLIYNKEALTPSTADKTLATGNLRLQSGLPEYLKEYAAMGGTANAMSYDEKDGVALSATTLTHLMAFLHIRAIVADEEKDDDFAAMSLFAETTSSDQKLKATGAACINKYYNIQLERSYININVDENKNSESYMRCTFPDKRRPVACTQQMIADDSRVNGKHYVDCFMALNPKNKYYDENNGNQPVTDYIINLYSCNEVIYNKHIRMTDILNKLQSGKIICINIDMSDPSNTEHTDAITVPGFHFSLSPGYVCGHRESIYDEWTYDFTGMWEDVDHSVKGKNQGIIRGTEGMNELYNEFFAWGGTTPDDLYYDWNDGSSSGNHAFRTVYQDEAIDVATLCDDGLWRSFNKNELDIISNCLENVSADRRSCIGYYESKEIDPITKLQKTYHIYGLFVGTSSQPKYADQDQYFFFPSWLDISDVKMSAKFTRRYKTPYGYEDRTFYVGTPAAVYRYESSNKCNGINVASKFSVVPGQNLVGNSIFVSIWSGAEGDEYDNNTNTAYRITFDGSRIAIGNYSKGLGRFVRGVRY